MKKLLIGALFLILATVVQAQVMPGSPSGTILPDAGVNGVAFFDQDMHGLWRSLGQSDAVFNGLMPTEFVYDYERLGLQIDSDENKVKTILIFSNRYKMQNGLAVGDTFSHVMQVLGSEHVGTSFRQVQDVHGNTVNYAGICYGLNLSFLAVARGQDMKTARVDCISISADPFKRRK